MAEVATDAQKRVDFLLDYLTASWKNLPNAAKEIDGWAHPQQIDYVEE